MRDMLSHSAMHFGLGAVYVRLLLQLAAGQCALWLNGLHTRSHTLRCVCDGSPCPHQTVASCILMTRSLAWPAFNSINKSRRQNKRKTPGTSIIPDEEKRWENPNGNCI